MPRSQAGGFFMRFTIRDMLWLTVVVGLCLAWFAERRNTRSALLREGQVNDKLAAEERRHRELFRHVHSVNEKLAKFGLKIHWLSIYPDGPKIERLDQQNSN
jgi:hypothetical protein